MINSTVASMLWYTIVWTATVLYFSNGPYNTVLWSWFVYLDDTLVRNITKKLIQGTWEENADKWPNEWLNNFGCQAKTVLIYLDGTYTIPSTPELWVWAEYPQAHRGSKDHPEGGTPNLFRLLPKYFSLKTPVPRTSHKTKLSYCPKNQCLPPCWYVINTPDSSNKPCHLFCTDPHNV